MKTTIGKTTHRNFGGGTLYDGQRVSMSVTPNRFGSGKNPTKF